MCDYVFLFQAQFPQVGIDIFSCKYDFCRCFNRMRFFAALGTFSFPMPVFYVPMRCDRLIFGVLQFRSVYYYIRYKPIVVRCFALVWEINPQKTSIEQPDCFLLSASACVRVNVVCAEFKFRALYSIVLAMCISLFHFGGQGICVDLYILDVPNPREVNRVIETVGPAKVCFSAPPRQAAAG